MAREFELPPLAVEDAVKAHQRPKLETYGEIVFAVLKPVRYVDRHEVVDVDEVATSVTCTTTCSVLPTPSTVSTCC